MTFAELVERAKRQLNAGQPQPHTWPESEIDIAACVMQAISAMADEAMRDDTLRGLLQQVYSITLNASGVGDLLTAVGSVTGNAGEILLEGVRYGVVIDNDGNVLQPLRHYLDFLSPQSTVYAYYCIKDGSAILTRALGQQVFGPNEVQSVSGPLTITASYSPESVEDIPPELEEPTVHALVRIVALKTYSDAYPNSAYQSGN